MSKLCLQTTLDPRHQSNLTNKEKADVLGSNTFLKLKIDINIMGRAVVGGEIQQDFISKEDTSSPTVAT